MSRERRGSEWVLHRAVFAGDAAALAALIRNGAEVDTKDPHGNTPLHLAVMLGYKDCIAMLLAHDAPVKTKNAQGWSPLAEAISYGDRQIITSLLRKLKLQSRDAIQGKKPHLLNVLRKLGDFYMELKWDFHSWIPLVSKILPSDVCKIYKKGTRLRMDTTLVDFNERSWERGDVSFLYDANSKPNEALLVLDNRAKVFQKIKYEECEAELEDEVDVLMSSDIVSAQMSTKTITFSRAMAGWIFKQEKNASLSMKPHIKKEQIADYYAEYYNVDGLYLDSKKRREHLSPEDVKKNKALIQNLQHGTVTEEEFKSEQFPLSVEDLLNVLEIVSPFKHLNKLRHFCQVRLPPGFPVRIEIPLLPTIVAKVTFQKFAVRGDLEERLFGIPGNFREDMTRFPDL